MMKPTFTCVVIFILSLCSNHVNAQTPQQTQSAITFTKLYGYIKYFHPSDEAAAINWDKLAIYGNDRVSKCKNNEELQKALQDIFIPIAPTLQLLKENDAVNFDIKKITPLNTKDYEVIAWQHFGVQSKWKNSVYKSARTNRPYTNASNGTEDKKHKLLFKKYPLPGEYIEKNIGSGLKIVLPLSLYGTSTQTYPVADIAAFNTLKEKLSVIPDSITSVQEVSTRLGILSISWNVFQHFYPYFDVVKTDWDAALKEAIQRAYSDKTADDFTLTLKVFTALLKDGHVSVIAPRYTFYPRLLEWEWLENQLVVTDVYDSIGIARGDIVERINDRDAKTYFDSVYKTISAATTGWRQYRARLEPALNVNDTVMKLDILHNGTTPLTILVPRKTVVPGRPANQSRPSSIREYPNDIMYINIGRASWDSIKKAMPKLQKTRVIICDLRGYPNNNHELINHLIKQKDTSDHWMQIAQTIYPDRENIVDWSRMGWHLSPLKPHLDAKIIFIIDGRAISYAESYMSFIEHYKLATIIGQPTAGTNGNVNVLSLPAAYSITWTGMKVQKHDGSVHHGVGILPNVYIEKTIKGVLEGRDEFLEKAFELAK